MMLIHTVALATIFIVVPVHDWYENEYNPVTDLGCCGDDDCEPVDVKRIEFTESEFIVDGKHHFPREWALYSKDGMYHFCIVASKPQCFFIPPNV